MSHKSIIMKDIIEWAMCYINNVDSIEQAIEHFQKYVGYFECWWDLYKEENGVLYIYEDWIFNEVMDEYDVSYNELTIGDKVIGSRHFIF